MSIVQAHARSRLTADPDGLVTLKKGERLNLKKRGGLSILQVQTGLLMIEQTSDEEDRKVLDFLGPKGVFVVGPQGPGGTLEGVALTASTVQCLDRKDLKWLRANDRDVADVLLDNALESLIAIECSCQRLMCQSAEMRVARFFSSFFHVSEDPDAPPQVLDVPMRRTDIADHIGIRSETLCRILANWRHSGLICSDGPRRITVIRPRELHRLAEGHEVPAQRG